MFPDTLDLKVFGDDVYMRANKNGNKLFKAIFLVESDFTWFEVTWNLPLNKEFSYYNGYLYGVGAQDNIIYKYKPRCKMAQRDQAEKVAENFKSVLYDFGALWALSPEDEKVRKKDLTTGASWEEVDGVECGSNLRRALGTIYCIRDNKIVAKTGTVPMEDKYIETFEVLGSTIVGVDQSNKKTIWAQDPAISMVATEYYFRENYKIHDIAIMNGKILAFRGNNKRIKFLN